MNSLPHISHHLFAAALNAEEQPTRPVERQTAGPRVVSGSATALPLELLSPAEDTPSRVTRRLRAAAVAVGT